MPILFTAAALLGGLGFLAVPIIAHWLNRRSRVQLVFPTLRFLRAAQVTQSRFFRIRRWILLALRCLMVACIVAAFAQPVWRNRSLIGGSQTAVVLLVDHSVSLQQDAGGGSAWQMLQAAGDRMLAGLNPGDVANIVEARLRPQAVFPQLSPNVPALRDQLRQSQPTFERAELGTALGLAAEQLRRHSGPRRLLILSDRQRTNWQTDTDLKGILPGNTRIEVIDLPGEPRENVALTQPQTTPAQPLIRQPVQVSVKVSHSSPQPRQVRVSAQIDDEAQPDQTIIVPAGQPTEVAFTYTPETGGDRRVWFQTTGDGFPPDDQASLVFSVADKLPVTILSDDPPDAVGSITYFLTRALEPTGRDADRFQATVLTSEQLLAGDNVALAPGGVVLTGYLKPLSPVAAQRLMRFVQTGGTVILFSGEGPVAENLEALSQAMPALGVGQVEPLVWTATVRRQLSGDQTLRISGGQWSSKWLREFDEPSQFALSQIPFYRVYAQGPLQSQAETWLTFSDGTAALASRPFGQGQFWLANFSPASEASDLGKHGVFVALLQILCRELRPALDTNRPTPVGTPCSFPVRAPEFPGDWAWVGPNQVRVPVRRPTVNEPPTVRLEHPEQPGFYTWMVGDRRHATLAVQLDPRESDLRRMSPTNLAASLGDTQGTVIAATALGESNASLDLPLWQWCLAAALVLMGVEMLCLALWRR